MATLLDTGIAGDVTVGSSSEAQTEPVVFTPTSPLTRGGETKEKESKKESEIDKHRLLNEFTRNIRTIKNILDRYGARGECVKIKDLVSASHLSAAEVNTILTIMSDLGYAINVGADGTICNVKGLLAAIEALDNVRGGSLIFKTAALMKNIMLKKQF